MPLGASLERQVLGGSIAISRAWTELQWPDQQIPMSSDIKACCSLLYIDIQATFLCLNGVENGIGFVLLLDTCVTRKVTSFFFFV
jgi:hypothetical protein